MRHQIVKFSVVAGLVAVAASACSSADESRTERFYCGAQPVDITARGEQLHLQLGAQEYTLDTVASASGARYENDDVMFWSKGNHAQLEIADRAYAECSRPGALIEPYLARGNEPFWSVEVEAEEAIMRRLGQDDITYSLAKNEWRDGQTHLYSDDESVHMVVSETLCQDDMSGMYYPQIVSLEHNGEELRGCGGSPMRLLEGVDWQVVGLGDTNYSEHEVTIRFNSDNSIVGRAGCNHYFGGYEITGEGLHFGNIGGTKMACSEPAMRIEYEFLGALADARAFHIDRDEEREHTDVIRLETEQGTLRLEHPDH